MDNSARWFLAGIVVSLINTGLVILFIGIPGITDRNDDNSDSVAERTYVVVVNEAGEIVSQRVELGSGTGEAMAAGTTASGEPVEAAATMAAPVGPTPLLGLAGPAFADFEQQPLFLTAHDGTAYVATGRFALQRVSLEGEVDDESLDGVEDLGGSRILDVDATTEGTLYVLVTDGPLEWRVFRRAADDDEWSLAVAGNDAGFPADAVALSVTDTGVIYVSASDPAGIIRVEPDLTMVRQWVSDISVVGLDAASDDTRLLFAAPEAQPTRASAQIRQVRSGRTGPWASTYLACGVSATMTAEEANVTVPQLPRDVAVVDNAGDGNDTALIVDSLNHVVWYQHHLGDGEPLFGVACGRGSDDAHLNTPRAVAIDEDGNVFISDTGNSRIVILPRIVNES
ncbi:MAG: hypothetical protein R3C39_04900 [Dehalococcoidia bacterium]